MSHLIQETTYFFKVPLSINCSCSGAITQHAYSCRHTDPDRRSYNISSFTKLFEFLVMKSNLIYALKSKWMFITVFWRRVFWTKRVLRASHASSALKIMPCLITANSGGWWQTRDLQDEQRSLEQRVQHRTLAQQLLATAAAFYHHCLCLWIPGAENRGLGEGCCAHVYLAGFPQASGHPLD